MFRRSRFPLAVVLLYVGVLFPVAASASPPPPPDAKPTDACSALRAAEYISAAVTTAELDVADNAMACGRAYLAQAPEFAAPLFLEAGDSYAKAAALRLRLAEDAGPLRDAQRREATVYWGMAWRAYRLAAQLNVTGAEPLAASALAHVSEPK